jgi:7-carboxy-7-deazaguanine synthase
MEISELFYSIQGEGKRAGKPSFFIRTNFCNLRCKFAGGNLCDTPYTSWEPNDIGNIGRMNVDKIIKKYERIRCKDVVITGGEPAMQSEELLELCRGLKESNSEVLITLETNGTIFGEFGSHIHLASISPKLRSSIPYGTKYEEMHISNLRNTEALKKFSELKSSGEIDIQWKFVFTGDDDIAEIAELQKEIGIPDEDVYLMPEGIAAEQLESKRKRTVEACIRNGYNYTDRLHIIVWGNERGV